MQGCDYLFEVYKIFIKIRIFSEGKNSITVICCFHFSHLTEQADRIPFEE